MKNQIKIQWNTVGLRNWTGSTLKLQPALTSHSACDLKGVESVQETRNHQRIHLILQEVNTKVQCGRAERSVSVRAWVSAWVSAWISGVRGRGVDQAATLGVTWRQEAAAAKLEVSAGDLLTLELRDLSTLPPTHTHMQACTHVLNQSTQVCAHTHTHTHKQAPAQCTYTCSHTYRRRQSGVSWGDRHTLAFQQPESLDRSGPHTRRCTKTHTHTHSSQWSKTTAYTISTQFNNTRTLYIHIDCVYLVLVVYNN